VHKRFLHNLLELQEAVQDMARAAGAANVHDEKAFKDTGAWQRQSLSEELDDQAFAANRRVLLLTAGVSDESLRITLDQFRTFLNQTHGLGSPADQRNSSKTALALAMKLQETIHNRIGELFRKMDDDEGLG
jgi:hypothetical protein